MEGDIPEEGTMTYSCDPDDGFKEPYYDFEPELSNPRRRVGFQEDTPRGRRRPKSACSAGGRRERLRGLTRGDAARPIRCSSALGIRSGGRGQLAVSPSISDEPPPDNSCIRSFRRSLKLLGLQLEGFDLNAAEPSPKPDIKNAKSKVNSLVTRRTVSLEDLHEAVVTVGFPLADTECGRHRQVLAKAVYEEWYFKKQEEDMKRKSEAKRQQKVKQWEMQHRRCEQMRKSVESYSEWLHKKKKQQQEQLRRGPTKTTGLGGSPSQEKSLQAYESWKKEKEKNIMKKLEEAKLRQKMLEDNCKKADSERAYQEWKKNADREWFLKIKKNERKVKELAQEEEKKMLDKKKDAEMAYRGWLETKEEDLKMKLKETRRAQALVQKRMATRRTDRLYESEQAFLSWLDFVEERFLKHLEKRRLQKQLVDD